MKIQQVGDIEVHKLVEIDRMTVDASWLLANLTPEILDEHREWLTPNLVVPGEHKVHLSFHSYVLRTPTLNILVDTCNGNHKQRPSMPAWHMLELPYLERLAKIGLRPEDIDLVMCTHLHTDHVGWNTQLKDGRWVPTFPRARYLMSRVDFDTFNAQHLADPDKPVNRGSFVDSVLPVVEHGQAVMVDPGDLVHADLADNMWLESSAGHSPGNLNIFMKSRGKRACMCGDVFHHAIQCARPDLYSPADYNNAQGVTARVHLLESYADTDMLVLAAHFPDPTAGRFVRHGDSYRFRFEDV